MCVAVFNILQFETGLSVYPETETRVIVLSVTDGFLIMTRFWPVFSANLRRQYLGNGSSDLLKN